MYGCLSLCCRKRLALHVRIFVCAVASTWHFMYGCLSLCCPKHLALHVRIFVCAVPSTWHFIYGCLSLCCRKHLALHVRIIVCAVASTWHFMYGCLSLCCRKHLALQAVHVQLLLPCWYATALAYMTKVGQNRIYTPYMTVSLVIYLLKIPCVHRIYVQLYGFGQPYT